MDLDYWDENYQSVKEGYLGPKGETAISINSELRNVKDQIETAFKFFEANDIIPTPSQLVEKYEERLHGTVPKKPEPDKRSNLVFPYYTNQAMNRDLKKLCKLSGINEEIRITSYKGNERIDEIKEKWELVGTHTGRRTFIVNALSRGIAPNVVMKWTGHSDYKAMKPYIDIVDSIKASEMSKMNFMD